jgi:hypothetical protein
MFFGNKQQRFHPQGAPLKCVKYPGLEHHLDGNLKKEEIGAIYDTHACKADIS